MTNTDIQYKRNNLLEGCRCGPLYAYETQGDFRHDIAQIRIVKEKSGWAVLTCEEDSFIFSTYRTGESTLRDAKAFVSIFLT